jgi:hypothetical protein
MRTAATVFFTFLFSTCFAQDTTLTVPDSINQRIFLIGDAGDMYTSTHPVIDWLKKNVNWNDEKNAVIYLGDNIYPLGLPQEGEADYQHSKDILDDQISLVKDKKAKAFFIPGNHDWRNGKLGGWEQVINQVDYINSLEKKNVQAWPLNGCPGPIQIELSDKVVVVLIDSQWFLFLHDKPGPGSNCDAKTIDEFSVELAEIAASHPNQMLIIATHHPLYSYGIHGGDYGLKEHIFPLTAVNPNLYIPLPIIGSIYPLARGVFGSVQDIPHPLYKTMINTIEAVLKKHKYPVAVAGHDHGLQYIVKDSIPYIVSGAGSVLTRTKPGRFLQFSDVNYGFSVIEVWKSGKADVKFYDITSKDYSTPLYTGQMKTIEPVKATATTVDTTRIILDSIVVVAGNPKLDGNGFKRFLIGRNYRAEWTQPLRVRVLDMSKEQGGLKPLKQGGGKQTKSLQVEDKSGKQWAFRSIQKNPEAAIPADLRQTVVRDLVQDGISASYPYGALSMGVLSKAAGIPYLNNKLVYLPDDPRLDRFRSSFKNMLALMEEREPAGIGKTDNTDELVLKLAKDNDDHVDQKAVLRARLLDNFVMDLDRHEGQWLWATRDTGRGKIYYPIPKDRDQVFYTNQGLVPYFIKKPWLVPELQGFRAHAQNINTFNRAARNFDRTFLTELSEDEWHKQVDTFLKAMTDDAIEKALHQQPPEIQKYAAEDIINTLKKRRAYFAGEMDRYYKFLSREVTVVGTNQREQFTITKNNDGSVHVVINKIAKDSTLSSKIYDRVFDPSVTKELRLFGLNDDDRFVVEGESSPIKIRIIGGSGNDEFINNSSTGHKVLAYDVSFEQNKFSGATSFQKRVFPDPQVNRYDRLNFKYNFIHPGLSLEYNVDDGLYLGPKLEFIKQGFRKEPYGMRQYISARRALRTASYHFTYEADFIKAIRNTDIIIRGDFKAPVNVTNFFGLGNNTGIDLATHNFQYYRARYNIINVSTYLSRQLQSWMRFNFGPTFQYFRLDSAQNVGRFVENTPLNGLDRNTLYHTRHYIGADARIAINSLNNKALPTRGFMLDAGVRPLIGLNGKGTNLIQTNFDMRIFMNLFSYPRLVLVTRVGWGKNYGHYEFPQAWYLGGTENLRGFRKQRFAGRSMLFNNTELRVKLTDFNIYLFPGSLGLLVFNDIGRVYVDGESSNKWHDGYGGGIWISPIKRFVFTVSLAHSDEEKILPRATFGFQF